MKSLALIALLPLALSFAPTGPQDPVAAPPAEAPPAVDVRRRAELGTAIFRPTEGGSRRLSELQDLAEELLGRGFAVESTSRPGGLEERRRLHRLDGQLVVIDREPERSEAVALLERLEQQLRQAEAAVRPVAREVAVSYTPRHISVEAAECAVHAVLPVRPPEEPTNLVGPSAAVRVTELPGLGTLVLQGQASDVATAEAFLARIDQPRPPLLVTVYALQARPAGEDAATSALPAELTAGLARLLPGREFQALGYGSVRTSAPGSPLSLVTTMPQGGELSLSAASSSFDPQSLTLGLSHCRLEARHQGDGWSPVQTQVLADFDLVVGEFAVVASAGARELYYVLHVARP
jgi:hypothetical protein